MKFKKIAVLSLLLICAFGFSACGGNDEDDNQIENEQGFDLSKMSHEEILKAFIGVWDVTLTEKVWGATDKEDNGIWTYKESWYVDQIGNKVINNGIVYYTDGTAQTFTDELSVYVYENKLCLFMAMDDREIISLSPNSFTLRFFSENEMGSDGKWFGACEAIYKGKRR